MAHSHLHYVSISTTESDDYIDILLGADVVFEHSVLETVVGEGKVPSAQRTKLGWALSGPDETMTKLAHRVNFTSTQANPEIERPCVKFAARTFDNLDPDAFVTAYFIDDKPRQRCSRENGSSEDS